MPKYFIKHGLMSPFHEVSRAEYVHEECAAHQHSHLDPYSRRSDEEPLAARFHGQRPNGRLGPVHVAGYVEGFVALPAPAVVFARVAPVTPPALPVLLENLNDPVVPKAQPATEPPSVFPRLAA